MGKHTVAIVQARMGSTRLPGKILKMLGPKTVLEHGLARVRACPLVDQVVVATTVNAEDDAVVAEAERCGVSWYRGSEGDVLSRYYYTAREFGADLVVRVTSDCPLFDPWLLARMLLRFREKLSQGRKIDYMSNTLERRTFPRGLDAEIFTFATLEQAFQQARQPYEREHVTPYVYFNPERFCLEGYWGHEDHSVYRWTLDTEEDLMLIRELYRALYGEGRLFSTEEALELMKTRPELVAVNQHVEQKKVVV